MKLPRSPMLDRLIKIQDQTLCEFDTISRPPNPQPPFPFSGVTRQGRHGWRDACRDENEGPGGGGRGNQQGERGGERERPLAFVILQNQASFGMGSQAVTRFLFILSNGDEREITLYITPSYLESSIEIYAVNETK